jgi:hypothetical protein
VSPGRVLLWGLLAYLYLDRFHAPDWVWGVFCTVAVLLLAGAIYAKKQEVVYDIQFEENTFVKEDLYGENWQKHKIM